MEIKSPPPATPSLCFIEANKRLFGLFIGYYSVLTFALFLSKFMVCSKIKNNFSFLLDFPVFMGYNKEDF